MALGKKAYPRATVKKIIKAHSNMNVKKNADVTVRKRVSSEHKSRDTNATKIFLNYVLFMETYVSSTWMDFMALTESLGLSKKQPSLQSSLVSAA